MAIEKRTRSKLSTPGPFLAEVTNHLDPTYMGSVEVALLKGIPNSIANQSDTYIVKYLSPFYGVTSVRFEGNDAGKFDDAQKSYGFWAIPPDVGTVVMVMFIDGDPNQGYWFGCVQDVFQNHMVPGIAASKQTNMTEDQKRKYGTEYLPVSEFNKRSQKLENPNPETIRKPVHPFADRLMQQGLLLDNVRGVTSSSARREVPSAVFGISTPGPVDTSAGAKQGTIGYAGDVKQLPVSRLGGSQFVMDDGDLNGQNELVRIRTRTGHQILLHNSHDLIYIANSKGTAWIEMTSNGKLDIYAEDSVSIHTKNDFNFRADRDIHLEAGRHIHMRALGDFEANITGHYYLIVDDEAKIAIRNDKHETVGQTSRLTVGAGLHAEAQNVFLTSAGDTHVGSGGNYYETASQIHMNGPGALAAQSSETPDRLTIYNLPNREFNSGWANSNFYKSTSIKSIMQRVPTHEPWDQHESINPAQFTSAATDSTLQNRPGVAPNPNSEVQAPSNYPEVTPGTCDPKYAQMINSAKGNGIQLIKNACIAAGITDPNAIASILGICGGESKWKCVTESFNYTSADRLLQVFPSKFKGNRELAQSYVGNPGNKLPEFLYGYDTPKGKELGNKQPGDGSKYIGRGYVQLTGRSNYTRYGQLAGADLVNNPDLLADPEIGAKVVAYYMKDRVKADQASPSYFEAACAAVGFNTPDIHATKKGLYECFLGQLKGATVGTGSGGILTDSRGNTVKTGG